MLWKFIEGLVKKQVSSYINQKLGTSIDLSDWRASDGLAHQLIWSLMGGLAKNTKSPQGANALLSALDKDHDGSVLDDLGDLAGLESKGKGIVQHILGSKKWAIAQMIAQKTGIDVSTVEHLLAGVAPVLMGSLGKEKRAGNLDTTKINEILKTETQDLDTDGSLDPFLSLLDKDGDGDVDLDDLTS